MSLYDAKISLAEKSQGLYLLKKLSKEHIHLTSYSRMRVDLAAEVCSNLCKLWYIIITKLYIILGAEHNSG